MKKFLFFLFLSLSFSLSFSQGIRKAVVAGLFYEKDPRALSSQIEGFLRNVKTKPSLSQEIQALIVPHAGYVYSGQVAAYAYSLVQGKDYETVVIIGPSHQYPFDGCSIYPEGGFETPLGMAKVDEALASEIRRASGFKYVPQAQEEEHSVEVQIPFIQKILPKAKIVPIIMGYPERQTIHSLASALASALPQKKVLVIASTDMSHYLPKEEANEVDSKTISLIQSIKTSALIRKLEAGENILCGGGAVAATLLYLERRGKAKVEILNYADSSGAGGPEAKVVGYLAAALYTEGPSPEFVLSSEEKKELLQLARSAINQFVQENSVLEYKPQNQILLTEKGSFVTLKKRGALRGCIGFIEPLFPLYETVIRATIYAASQDPRFPPITKEELKDLEIEISVLSPLKKISDPSLVRVGKHGLVISMGNKKGLLLPQVAVENHWTREVFLDQACLKAGLRPDAWRTGADIFIFEAIVFD